MKLIFSRLQISLAWISGRETIVVSSVWWFLFNRAKSHDSVPSYLLVGPGKLTRATVNKISLFWWEEEVNIDTNGSVPNTFESIRSALTGIGLMMQWGIWIICYRVFDLSIININIRSTLTGHACHTLMCAYKNRERSWEKGSTRSIEDSLWDCRRGLSAIVACYPVITLDIKHGLDINILSITFFIIVIQGWPHRVLPF